MNQSQELTPEEVAKWSAYIDQLTAAYSVSKDTPAKA